jgi:hypothetical protein
VFLASGGEAKQIKNMIAMEASMKASAALWKDVDAGDCWRVFRPGDWRTSISVRDFIVRNVTPYLGNEAFLVAPSQRTKAVWAKLQPYFTDERKKGVLSVDAKTHRPCWPTRLATSIETMRLS